jgi:hypothetical protein
MREMGASRVRPPAVRTKGSAIGRRNEKGGKRHEMPAHDKLEAFLDEYVRAAELAGDGKSPCSALPSGAPARSRPRRCTGSTLGA